jgi:hypothetical protein
MALKTLEKDYLNFLQEVKSLIQQGHQKFIYEELLQIDALSMSSFSVL